MPAFSSPPNASAPDLQTPTDRRPLARWYRAQGAPEMADRVEAAATAEAARQRLHRQMGLAGAPEAVDLAALDPKRVAVDDRPMPNPGLASWPRDLRVADDRRWRGEPAQAPRVGVMEGARGGLLRHAHWSANGDHAQGTLVLLPGRNEPLEKYQTVIPTWQARGFEVFALDWQGQGQSSRYTDDPERGDIPGYDGHLHDLRQWLNTVVRPAAQAPLVMQAHSMGGHLGLRYLAEHAEEARDIRGAVVTAPLLDLATPSWMPRWGLKLLSRVNAALGRAKEYAPFMGPWEAKPFEGNDLTSDQAGYQRLIDLFRANPDMRLGGPSNRWVLETYRSIEATETPDYFAQVQTPVLLVSAGADTVVDPGAHQRAAAQSAQISLETIGDGARHDLWQERPDIRARLDGMVTDFLGRLTLSPAPGGTAPGGAALSGAAKEGAAPEDGPGDGPSAGSAPVPGQRP